MSNLIVRRLRKLACVVVYLISTPFRLVVCTVLTIILPIMLAVSLLLDLHCWGCNNRNMSSWDDWTFLELPKLCYWDFLILGKWPEL